MFETDNNDAKQFLAKNTHLNNTPQHMKTHEFVGISCKIHHLAWLNWVKDGRPQGLDLEYWQAAESLLITEHQILANPKTDPEKLRPVRVVKSHAQIAPGARKKLHIPDQRGTNIKSPAERRAL